jgi:predicted DNA-binding transcriptional regulator AlpA
MTELKRRYRAKDLRPFTGWAESTLYQKVAKGLFPKPHRISHKVAVWTEKQLLDWQKSQGFEEECDA